MDARELQSCIHYLGMERDARKLVLKDKLAKPEDVAIMTELEVYEVLLTKYRVIMRDSENILLIEEDRMSEFDKMAVYLSR